MKKNATNSKLKCPICGAEMEWTCTDETLSDYYCPNCKQEWEYDWDDEEFV
jgi:predicted RNA-binding Zn-ribbon protein involved in translation (DUF1610 family)